MKTTLTILSCLCIIICKSQSTTQNQDHYLSMFSSDTGKLVPPINLLDANGKKVSLNDFKGKILYLDFWIPGCTNCFSNFPLAKQLHERIKYLKLDTGIVFINIFSSGSTEEWKNLTNKYNPEGISLYSPDTSFYQSWGSKAFPHYSLVSRNNKFLASYYGLDPRTFEVDYILYEAITKNMNGYNSYLMFKNQNEYHAKNMKYEQSEEGKDYGIWYNSIIMKIAKDRNLPLKK
ncbi:MAG: hypothetical protein DI598_04935 [Pseudopedobacter saltans]|uniref:Thioredoxin domain-containing protein n=1 Tax=Pseudopedobacter saltans TaxID=151895 RepID=A0A2W5F7B9_9SPHI|nr:MAG: hypothetical protein DI598_04935 [Pseudopedobacter saltans]